MIPFAIALTVTFVSATLPSISKEIIGFFGYVFAFIYGTEIASAIIAPLFLFKGFTPRQKDYLVLSFSIVLATLFLKGFANVMGKPLPTVGLLGLIDYRVLLSFGKPLFHFLSTLVPFVEIVCISTIFYLTVHLLFLPRR